MMTIQSECKGWWDLTNRGDVIDSMGLKEHREQREQGKWRCVCNNQITYILNLTSLGHFLFKMALILKYSISKK